MCRWLAYSGSPVLLEELLYKPKYSLIDQSLHSRLGATTTNGDGFGVGWYGDRRHAGRLPQHRAGLERPQPAELARHIALAARLRAHPRVHRHGGAADELPSLPPRPLALDAQRRHPRLPAREARPRASPSTPTLYPEIEGSTDSETFFYLALTFGLEDDPPKAVQEAVGFIEATGRRHGVEHPIQMTVATTDGESIWAFRYSSEGDSRSLFFSTDLAHAADALPGRRSAAGARRRVAAGRLGAARDPGRSLERGARVELGRRPAGPGRDAPFAPTSAAKPVA